MNVYIEFDSEKNKPIVCLEPETEGENVSLELVAMFETASFRLVLDDNGPRST